GEPMSPGALDGVDWSWGRVKGSEALIAALKRARDSFDVRNPPAAIPPLLAAWSELDKLPDSPWKEDKQREFTDVIAACAALYTEPGAADPEAVPSGQVAVTASAINRSATAIQLEEIRFTGATAKVGKALPMNEQLQIQQNITVAANAVPTGPHWLEEPP